MSSEIQVNYQTGRTVYTLIRDRTGQIWNVLSGAFQAYNSVLYPGFPLSLTEQGTSGGGFYAGNFPSAITAGVYGVTGKVQGGASPIDGDATIGVENYQWNGVATLPLSDLASSGQIGQIGPIRMARGVAVSGFPFKLVSSADHITPFVSGVVSGQVSRNGAAFGPLQSGLCTEVGLGWFRVNLTSGDMLGDVVALVFTAIGISGGNADQRDFAIITQRTSGSL